MNENLKILIADDSELMRMVMKGFFKKFLLSPEILETSNLPDAFEVLEKQNFDFLLLDINMPRGDSNPNTVKEVLKKQPHIKICMFTGNDKATLERSYLEAGAVGFIQKDENMGTSLEEVLKRIFN
ncbi:response regulator [Pedobacter frigidisoli]|uniref:Response regulator n=1 Tax=Pedobacter frigidisoli TaxID=2530455 RepID=A0A4R0P407_9SPHI|nr:response regulator [Pedobacter frigidisoli]TCD10432.1 response regulator [Pedobacter frigidisoli]